ncbi:hypothetical protein [Lutimonas sp.]|uniref:hypothetical protein n=1 Tax=Lutimonas sp. TaxID=1872403 RepID=UPI003D9B99A3
MKKLIIFCFFILVTASLLAQKKEKLSPVELMFEYYDEEFKPFNKGKWFTALTFNIEDTNLKSDNKYIGFDNIIEGSEFNYEVKIKGGYSVGNYSFFGLGITHGRDKSEGRGIIILDTISSESVAHKNVISPFMRNYYPLSKNQRLSFFNEVKMDFGFGNSETKSFENSEETERETTNDFLFGIGISPGITFFALESFAFEIQLDVLGYEYERSKTTDDEGNEFTSDSHNVNFTLDLLSLNFGLAYYFGAKN